MMRYEGKPGKPRKAPAPWTVLILTLLVAAPAILAQVPADSLFRDFQPVSDFQFELAGKALDHAEIFQSQRAAAYLVIAPELASPLLINPRTSSVESVHLMKVARQSDGSIDLLADATFGYLSSFRVVGTELAFEVKGETARLKPKPPLLGLQSPEALRSYKPEYGRDASSYHPSPPHLQALRDVDQEARILIYFGTWCPTCGRLVPHVLRVDEELRGSKLRFEYYGLPHEMSDDPVTERDDIHGVPTGIVYVGGQEIARLGVKELNQPEAALFRILSSRQGRGRG